MHFIRSVLHELVGLFIDDGRVAMLCVLLIGVTAALIKLAGLAPHWGGLLLLGGCLLILIHSVRAAGPRP